jgi:hypothetical protein
MRNPDVIATYSHTDGEVRFLMRYTAAVMFLSGIAVGGFIHAFFH